MPRPFHRLLRPVASALAVLLVAAATVLGAAAPAQAAPPSALTFTEGVDPGAPTVLVEPGTASNSALYADTAPPGMWLEFFGAGDSGIRLAGTPEVDGVYHVRYDVTFPGGPWMQAYTTVVTVLPSTPVTPAPAWTTTTLGPITRLSAVSVGLAASDTTSFAITAGSLPAGLSLVGGTISGTVTAAPGPYSFTVTATGPGGSTAQAFSGSVAARDISWPAPVVGPFTVGVAVSQQFSGTNLESFAVTAGSLPAGLALSPTGLLSGTPTAGGSSTLTITAWNSDPSSTSRSVTIVVNDVPPVWQTSQFLGDAGVGLAYSKALVATDAVSYAVTAGSLPLGLSLSTGGVISGIPTAAGVSNFTVTATKASGGSAARAFELEVLAAPIWVGETSVVVTVGHSKTVAGHFENVLTVNINEDPTGPFRSSASRGLITVTGLRPGTGATFPLGITTVHPSLGVRIDVTVLAEPVWVTESIGALRQGVAVDAGLALEATDATGYAITAGNLPAGLSLAADGSITGTPTTAGPYTFTVGATNGDVTVDRQFTGSVKAPLVVWVTDEVDPVPVDHALGLAFVAKNAATLSVVSGSLPTGTALSADGLLTGTPTVAGSSTFTIRATNADGESADREFTLDVLAPATWTGPTSLLLTVGDEVLLDSGGNIVGGRFHQASFDPDGGFDASLRSADLLAIGAHKAGTATLYIDLENALGVLSSVEIVVEVRNAPVWVSESLGALREGVAVDAGLALEATDATGFAIVDGELPDGLALAADGSVTGTPTAFGAYDLTVEATNGDVTVARQFTGTVNAPVVTWTTTTVPLLHEDVAAGVVFAAEHAASFAVTDGALPDGLTLAADGTLAGSPTEAGTFEVEVTATNATGEGVAQSFTIVVDEPVLSVVLDGKPGDAASGLGVIVTGSGLSPDAAFDVTLFSDPIVVESGVVAADGTIDVAASLPDVVPFGAHELRVTAVGADGEPFTTSVWFSVGEDGEIIEISTDGPVAEPERTPVDPTPAPTPAPAATTSTGLASTGVEPSLWFAGAGLLLALGAALVLVRRRRAEDATR
ncbi:Ig domain-containing protein [Agromyces sp. Leaf222]|uniref:Ig domain-containing protein n=1 Tax=Agromyces sp. Leaf222 TaxID=1735688 RepID=UPI001F3AC0F1|nr:Ig domain-containing protein [Agromyces sp. Leaf222]